MSDNKADIEADISAVIDRKETVALMEPLLIAEGSRHRGELTDLAVDVAARSAGFRRSLPNGVRTALADLVRAMNCYYSNLIEGHDTHPVDIERALKNDYSNDPHKAESCAWSAEGPRCAGRSARSHQPRRGSAISCALRGRLWPVGENGRNSLGCGCASPPAVDTPVPRWQWARRKTGITRDSPRDFGYWWNMVGCTRPRPKCRGVQKPSRQLRSAPPERS